MSAQLSILPEALVLRYAVAALVSAVLGLVDLPPGQLGGLLSWRKRTSAWVAPLYLAVTGAAGAAAVALASVGATAVPEQQQGILGAALLGTAGHGCMRATVRGQAAGGEQALAASTLERTRNWLAALLRVRAADEVLPLLRRLPDTALLELAADLASPALEALSVPRRKELAIVLSAAATLRETAIAGREHPRSALRTALRAEIVKQGASRRRVTGARRVALGAREKPR